MKVKVCGVQREEDVAVAAEAGADMVGLLVADVDTPRAVSVEEARELAKEVPAGMETVAVDTSKDPYDALEKLDETGADLLQMHRDDLSARELRDLAGSCRLIQVEKVGEELPDGPVEGEYVLLDSRGVGGTGETHDWELSREFVEESPSPVILAGGLHPGNVAEAIEQVRPAGVDAASRLDAEDGEGKDPGMVRRFVENAEGA